MMTSLFSMFDPTAMLNIQVNWIIMTMTIILIPSFFWKAQSRSTKTMNAMIYKLDKEFNSLFMSKFLMKGSTLIPISLFLLIMINNITSNFPYTFCSSAHLVFSLAISVPIWMSIILFYWMSLTKTMLAHLVPTGTPSVLMPLMVMIELTSNLIRPMALAVRLTANLIAGHLLMALLGSTFNINSKFWMIILSIQIVFMVFELMVALIQSYVFSVLITLYSSEIS
uniref:ATP synthase subunit a n=1 Tax=Paratrioza sinica TaxID=1511640 RepID=A0A068EUE4_9HEMI|nr:ATP synthase F0 subunit 6 [Paratrioza sinica]AID54951.1 ATP synthase F0 subunit 6 [Paratrioza sinica]